ncbi:MAG: DnaJ domain-containing protein [Alphaproteobacteria bacterium]|jgi:hypothetical protein|nr:DnaJ domain-containing protein [Alphaproteobacteria bacterium]MBT5861214.1 DnaJ domain-containing protein [Alphaproteobacteria bacterium]
MPWLILGTSVLVAFVLAGSFFANAPPKTLAKALKWGAIGLGILLLIGVLATGRGALLLPLVLFGIPAGRRMLRGGGFRIPGMGSAPSSGNTSEVETATLRMVLDHDSGTVDGEVIAGTFAGRGLGDLKVEDLVDLLDECRRDDAESAPLVEAYLDRAHPEWRQFAGEGYEEQAEGEPADPNDPGGYDTPMNAKEARGILEVGADATGDDIKKAHHRLMKKMHPDQGGSNYLASKINQAKDVLLGS